MAVHNHGEISSFDDIFKKEGRHSRCVNILKFFLPLLALAITLFFCWSTFFFTPVSYNPIMLNNEESRIIGLVMVNPKLEGYTSSYESYWLKADKAFQDLMLSGVIGLQNITAEIFMGKERVFVNAQEGIYDNINGFLRLNKPFTVTTKNGMVARFTSADINLSDGQLNTNKRINIHHADLDLTADALQIQEKRQILHFQGGVHLVISK
ncbi:LPS export ABC transporter periplasmic protein LptC [Bartonella sp. B10]